MQKKPDAYIRFSTPDESIGLAGAKTVRVCWPDIRWLTVVRVHLIRDKDPAGMPEVIIIRNASDKASFNRMVNDFNGGESAKPLGEIKQYPCFVLTMDRITCGIRRGTWDYFDSIEKLEEIVETDGLISGT